ncbi:MAG: MFS transporter, partial [Acutalibacteraceae bacterium]
MKKQRREGTMTLGEKIGFGFGPVGKTMASSLVYGSFLSLYFMQVFGLSPAYLSVMFLLCRVWDGLNDLFMGAIIDATHSRFGKFKPWIIAGALTNAACTILIYFDPGFRGVGIYIWATVLYVLCDMTYTMIDVSYWALVPAMTLDRNERDQLAVIPRITSAAGGIVSSFTLNIVDKLGGRGSNAGF